MDKIKTIEVASRVIKAYAEHKKDAPLRITEQAALLGILVVTYGKCPEFKECLEIVSTLIN